MSEPQEVEGHATAWGDYVTADTLKLFGFDGEYPCMITPKTLWDQRQEALLDCRNALVALTPTKREIGCELLWAKAVNALHELPGIEP